MDAAFGHWLAGFIDGEGHFAITPNNGTLACKFVLHVRDDDRAVVERIREETGIGVVQAAPRPEGQNDMVRWCVQAKADCRALIELLDAHPLRAKKMRDYAIWRDAVFVWHALPVANRSTRALDYSQMAALKAELQAVRRYEPAAESEPAIPPQLRLVG